jgi:hypothetical protein
LKPLKTLQANKRRADNSHSNNDQKKKKHLIKNSMFKYKTDAEVQAMTEQKKQTQLTKNARSGLQTKAIDSAVKGERSIREN